MAEPITSPATAPSPVLHSTADQVPYVPVSWLAVAAAAAAGFLALLLAIMGIIAFRAHRPLLEESLLVFALLAIVLSFVARRVVRNSEGTRTGTLFGIDLISAAWWGGLVLGLGYGSYLRAIEYSIRKDARNEVQAWTDLVMKGDPKSMTMAFHRTQDPNQRKGIRPEDATVMEGRWGKEWTAFRQCDLARVIARNPDCKLELGGLKNWQFKSNVECEFTATLTCIEGTFPIKISLRGFDSTAVGTEAAAGRQWQIDFLPSGYIEQEKVLRTPYGWYVLNLTIKGIEYGQRFLTACATSREVRSGAFIEFVSSKDDKEKDEKFLRPLTNNAAQARSSVVGIPAGYLWTAGPEFLDYTADKLFALPGSVKPNADQNKVFRNAWNTVGIVRAGERLRESTDVNEQLILTETSIEMRVPIEIPLSASKGAVTAARGKLVLICTDPAILAEAKRYRESAVLSQATPTPGEGISLKEIPWRVLWVESDLKPIQNVERQLPGGGPPGMGGPG